MPVTHLVSDARPSSQSAGAAAASPPWKPIGGGQPAAATINSNVLTTEASDLLGRINASVTAIERDLKERQMRELIVREWRQVTRVLERLLILVFVFIVAAFAYSMLGSSGKRLVLTDEVMRSLSKIDNDWKFSFD